MRTSLALTFASISLLACGGKVVFSEEAGSGGSGGTGGTTGIGAAQTTGAGASGSVASSASGTETGTTMAVGSTGSMTTSVSTGSGTGVIDPTITCGNQTCDGTTEACCLTMQGQSCIPEGGSCQGPKLDCSKTANCAPGEVCCFQGGPGGGASCRDMCGGGGPGGGVQLCETDAECLNGEPCTVGKGGIKRCDGFGPGGG